MRFFTDPSFENPIHAGGFILEPLERHHAGKLFLLAQDPTLYFFIPITAPKSVEDLEAKYARWSQRHSPDNSELWLNYAIFRKGSDNYVGTLQATISLEATYIAYEIYSDFRRKGFGKAAVRALTEYLFREHKVDVVTAHVDSRNEASIALLRSLSFKLQRKMKDADFFKGESSDELVFTLKRAGSNTFIPEA